MGRIKTDNNHTRREVIIANAAVLFKEKGFKAASMRELADVVGVEAASLSQHKVGLAMGLCPILRRKKKGGKP